LLAVNVQLGEQTRRIGQQQRGGVLDPQAWVIPVPCSITVIELNNKDGGLLQSLKNINKKGNIVRNVLHQEISF
jgi:hypothetical protein